MNSLSTIETILVGGAIIFAAESGWFGWYVDETLWQVRFDRQLEAASLMFQLWMAEDGVNCSQPNFRHTNLSMSVTTSTPFLEAKAANCVVVSRWLASLFAFRADIGLESRFLTSTLWGFVEWLDINHLCASRGSVLLSPDEVGRLRVARQLGLSGFRFLSSFAATNYLNRYNMVPKYHALDHALRRAVRTGVSFGAFWVYRQEDFMGVSSRIASKVHPSAVCVRVIERWISDFFDHDSDSDESI